MTNKQQQTTKQQQQTTNQKPNRQPINHYHKQPSPCYQQPPKTKHQEDHRNQQATNNVMYMMLLKLKYQESTFISMGRPTFMCILSEPGALWLPVGWDPVSSHWKSLFLLPDKASPDSNNNTPIQAPVVQPQGVTMAWRFLYKNIHT